MTAIRLALVAFVAAIGACVPPPTTGLRDEAGADSTWMVLRELLRQKRPILDTSAAEPDFSQREVRPSVLPQTMLYVGTYFPPHLSHVRVNVVGARHPGGLDVLETADDWARLRKDSGWVVRTSAEAVDACAEFVLITHPERLQGALRVYTSPGPWSDAPPVILPEQLEAFAHEPSAARSQRGWQADLTLVARGRTVRVRCFIGRADATDSYLAVDSVIGPGFPVR